MISGNRDPARPNPDELLERVSRERQHQQRGRLRVYFGAAPGVGKTFAMLEAARTRQRAGEDVVVGVVETHGRPETEALLAGLECLPRRKVSYRGAVLEEFDADAALARRPALLLVDELAHSNSPGSRHVKRWQDVLEMRDGGIDVYTTLNVQHLESLNDVVRQITGVEVRETVPDSILEQADEIELVDLPAEDLRKRLDEGKVYLPEQAERAKAAFFREGNLIALRELALRRTADRVDAQMRLYRSDHAIVPTWPVAERLIVSIGPSPFSAKLIRAGKRMAERLQAEWIVAFVETPRLAAAGERARARVAASLRLAEQLGAETVTLSGASVADSLLSYARSRNVSRIVLGKHAGSLWRRLWLGSVLDDLIAKSGDIEIAAISGEPEAPARAPVPARSVGGRWRDFLAAAGVIGAVTLVSLPLRAVLAPANLVMFYLAGVVAVAMRASRSAALLTSVLSVAAFDFFCVPPYLTFAVSDYQYLLTFAVMLIVGAVISSLTVRVRLQAVHAAQREARTQALYRLTRELSGDLSWVEAGRKLDSAVSEVMGHRAVLFMPGDSGAISFRRRSAELLPVPAADEAIAQWVFDHGQPAGKGTGTLAGAAALYIPLRGSRAVLGVMAAVSDDGELLADPDRRQLLEVFARQTALAIERTQATLEARQAQLRAETERMRGNLLSAVSHDLRTPLAAITGAASSLRAHGRQMPEPVQDELLESIESEAARLGRLVGNLIEMTRLESGAITVNKEWHPVEEIIGAALTRLERLIGDRPVAADLPAGLMVPVDDVLFEQVLWNVLENAVKYAPAESPITVSARADNGGVTIEIADEGPGFAPGEENLVWDRFYRGRTQGTRGAGLGLAICRAIMQAHRGRIEAENRPQGGALIRIWTPGEGRPPELPDA